MILNEKLQDNEVINRVLAGEKGLYEIIIRRYNPYLYKTGRSYNYSHEDTQDLMQESFIDAYKNLAAFEGRSSFKTWIIRIMLNHCYRKKQKLSFKLETAAEINENSKTMFTINTDVNTLVQNKELGQVIEYALGAIPEDYRLVFSLREINGLNVAETADVLAITEANVKVRLNRAKSMLRKEIEKQYTPAEIFEFNLVYCDAMVEKVMARI